MRVPGIPYVQGQNKYTDRDGKKYGMAIHDTSNNASDEDEASYATHRPDGTSSHFYIDDDSIIQSIDTDYRVGHAGSYEGNEHAIAFEITGTDDKTRTWWLNNVAWSKLAQVIAYMIKNDPDLVGFQVRRASVAEMKTNPKVKAFYGHNDMRLAWGGTTHTDPGPNFPWDHFLSMVKQALEGDDVSAEEVWATKWVGSDGKTYYTADSWLRNANIYASQAKEEAVKARLSSEAVLAAVKGIDDEGIKTLINSKAAELRASVENVDEALMVKLSGTSVEETANVLRRLLGDNAVAVGALLSQPTG